MRKQSRRRIKIIVFFYLFLFFFLLNNPEFSHFRARCGTAWNAASTFRAAIKRNGRQFDRGCERVREREKELRARTAETIVSRATHTLRIYKSRVYTRARGFRALERA